jgi:ATP-dependent DNA helicase DinG
VNACALPRIGSLRSEGLRTPAASAPEKVTTDGPLAESIALALGDDGALAHGIDGFVARSAQQRMATAVAEAIDARETLLVEAGTGTGKTFAYLVPAVLSGLRVVISTGTKNLQDQLYHRDLPQVLAALGLPVRTALLKGRANYLCRSRLKQALAYASPDDAPRLIALRHFMEASDSGELSDYGGIPDGDPLLPRVTSTADNCLGTRCADYDQCFVAAARRRATTAEIVVVNHHLLFADFVLKQEGFGEILPGADVVVVDEAHQLPELASRVFGDRLSTRQLHEFARDATQAVHEAGDLPELIDACARLTQGVRLLEQQFLDCPGREPLARFRDRGGVDAVMESLLDTLDAVGAGLSPVQQRSEALAAVWERCTHLSATLRMFLSPMDPEAPVTAVDWVERLERGGSLQRTPVDVSVPYQQATSAHPGAWIYTSATLSIGGDFRHFSAQLGLESTRMLALESPFDYTRQARIYLPTALPDPNSRGYTEALIDHVMPLIDASGGGAFLLMTSHRAVQAAARHLRGDRRYTLFVQGEDDRARLVRRFAETDNGILVGAASFWEGVDVPGRALRLVLIDKLPFAAPDDPVFEARLNAIRISGGRPFPDYQLPQAIIGLRQGVGRLIRGEEDRGLLILGDPRLRSRGYGAQILRALPDMPVLEDFDAALSWSLKLAQELTV